MAIVKLESCGHITSNTDLIKKWPHALAVSFTATGSARGGPAFILGGTSIGTPVTVNALIVGMRWAPSAFPGGVTDIMRFNETTTTHISVAITPVGAIAVYRGGSSGTLLAQTGPNAVTVGTFHHIAAYLSIHDTTGAYTVKVDNATVLTATNVDTRNGLTGNADRFLFQGGPTSSVAHDFFIFDTTGGVNNDFPGDVRVDCLMPEAAGNYTQWTPSAGSNFQNVDETDPDDDTTYNSNGTAGQKDSYQHASLTALTTEDIKGVQTVYWVKKTDAGSRSLKCGVRSNTTDDLDAGAALPSSYEPRYRTYDVDPATGTQWTKSAVDALETLVETV